MPAPKKNAYWKNRTTHGSPKHFPTPEALYQAWVDYFTWSDANPWYKIEQLKRPIVTKTKSGKSRYQTTIRIETKRPYTEAGFLAFHGLGRNYINEFERRLKPPDGQEISEVNQELSGVLSWARNICWADKYEGAAVGAYNVSIISRDLGLRDEHSHTLKGDKDNPIQTETKTTVIRSTLKLS